MDSYGKTLEMPGSNRTTCARFKGNWTELLLPGGCQNSFGDNLICILVSKYSVPRSTVQLQPDILM